MERCEGVTEDYTGRGVHESGERRGDVDLGKVEKGWRGCEVHGVGKGVKRGRVRGAGLREWEDRRRNGKGKRDVEEGEGR